MSFSRSTEWRRNTELRVAKLDVQETFDATSLDLAKEAEAEWFAGAAAGARLVRERQAGRMTLHIPGMHERPSIVKHRGLYHGAASSPKLLQWTTDFWVWSHWGQMAAENRWGASLDGKRLACVTWAGDTILMTTSVAQLREMWKAANDLLRRAQFDIDEDD